MTTDNEGARQTYHGDTGRQAGVPAASWDWRKVGGRNFITPSQDQGACQASTGFAVADVMNVRLRTLLDIAIGQPNQVLVPDLSAGEIFYCAGGTCDKGLDVETALGYAADKGVVPAYSIPYKAVGGTCGRPGPGPLDVRVTRISGFNTLRTLGSMKDAIQSRGPIIAVLRAYQDLKSYTGGVYRYNGSAPFLYMQTVSVIGFTPDGWLCKNSWGPGWGMGGVFLIAYGECGIDDEAMWEITGLITIYPNGTVAGTPAVLETEGVMHVFYRDNGDNIQDLSGYPPSGTQPFPLDGLAAGGNPVGMVNRNAQIHVARIDIQGWIQDNFWDNGWSQVYWLTGPQGFTDGPPALGDLTMVPYIDQLHLFYSDADGNIHWIWFDGRNWNWKQITNAPGLPTAPPAAGPPKVLIFNSILHVCYRDTSGNIQDVYGYPTYAWSVQQLTNNTRLTPTPAPTAAGDPAVVGYNSQMHVVYRDKLGVLHDVLFETSWGWQTLPTFKFAAGDPACVDYSKFRQMHVVYRDAQGNVCDTFYTGQGNEWVWQQLTGIGSLSCGLPASGDPVPTIIDGNMHVHYCDINSNLSDVYWDGTGWHTVTRI